MRIFTPITEKYISFYERIDPEKYDKPAYLSWKRKNVTLRGMKEFGIENDYWDSTMGAGLYTAFLGNKAMAKEYGKVYFVVNAIPKHPKVVRSINEWEIYRHGVMKDFCEKVGEPYSRSCFNTKTELGKEIQKLGFDGVII